MSINKNAELLPYYKKAKEFLNYDSETGIFTKFVKYKGTTKEAGCIDPQGYRRISIRINGLTKNTKAHRLAWFMTYGELPNVIDHIDGNPLNNAIKNLRSCTQQQNTFNRGAYKNNTSGYKGVYWHKMAKKFQAKIGINGKLKHLGLFNTAKEASEVYEAKAKELFGEYYSEQQLNVGESYVKVTMK